MSFEAHRAIIETTFATEWAASSQKTVPVFFDNVPFTQPTGPFLTVRIFYGDGAAAEITGALSPSYNRYSGFIQIDVQVLEETGTALARRISDEAARIFRRKVLYDAAGGTTTCRVPTIKPFGVVQGRYRLIVSAPFTWDIRE